MISLRRIKREVKVLRKFYKLQRQPHSKKYRLTDAECILLGVMSRRNKPKSQINFIK